MSNVLSAMRTRLAAAFSGLVTYAARLSPSRLAWGGLGLAAVTLLSINLIASETLGGWKADLTEDRLFTISPGSVTVLKAMEEPIQARVYFSKKLGEVSSSYKSYFDRIRTLLEDFRRISGGKLELEILDPEPFSDAEDQAVAAGLSGRRLNAEGEMAYFGLTATNSTDNQEVIGFFSPDRENFLEYDVTKLIHALSSPKKRLVGIMTSLPLEGGQNPMTQQETPAWMIMSQIREFFDVETVDQSATEIPSRIDVLLVAQPTTLTPQAAYAVDQYALKGGKLLVLIDPMAEAAQLEMMQKQGEGRAELAKLLKTWGVGFDPKKTAADIRHARRVQFGRSDQGMVTEYVAWLGLDKSNIDQRDVLSSGIESLNLASAGILTPEAGATTAVTPILVTSPEAMAIDTASVGMSADPVALLRNYVPGGHPLMLAARISGEAKTTFPNGAPKPAEKKDDTKSPNTTDAKKEVDAAPPPADAKPGPGHVAAGHINAIIVADTDLLADRFWVESREMLGQQFVMPSAGNAAFIVGALENLSGSDALIALRGRGIKERTFTLVEDLRRDAERKFREKEEALTAKLKSVEQELEKLQNPSAATGSSVIVSDKEREAIEGFKDQMLETRRELRQVKLALGQSIDSLDNWLKFANIALVPLLIAAGGVGWSLWRSRRTPPKS